MAALDSDLGPDQVAVLAEATSAAFEAARTALSDCPESERESLVEEIEELRRHAALAQDAARRAHAQAGARLGEVRRARQALAQLEQRSTGESCDIAG